MAVRGGECGDANLGGRFLADAAQAMGVERCVRACGQGVQGKRARAQMRVQRQVLEERRGCGAWVQYTMQAMGMELCVCIRCKVHQAVVCREGHAICLDLSHSLLAPMPHTSLTLYLHPCPTPPLFRYLPLHAHLRAGALGVAGAPGGMLGGSGVGGPNRRLLATLLEYVCYQDSEEVQVRGAPCAAGMHACASWGVRGREGGRLNGCSPVVCSQPAAAPAGLVCFTGHAGACWHTCTRTRTHEHRCTYTCPDALTLTRTHAYTHGYTHTQAHTHGYTHTHTHTHTHTRARTRALRWRP